jgi:cell division protein FtsB
VTVKNNNKNKIATYPEDNKNKEKQLKAEIRRLKAENKKLKSELKTLNRAFDKTAEFLGYEVKDLAVEEVISMVNKGLKIK